MELHKKKQTEAIASIFSCFKNESIGFLYHALLSDMANENTVGGWGAHPNFSTCRPSFSQRVALRNTFKSDGKTLRRKITTLIQKHQEEWEGLVRKIDVKTEVRKKAEEVQNAMRDTGLASSEEGED